MADLIVGLSKTAVQLLADKVKSAIKEEAEQWKIVQRDLVFITGEFEMMQAFLDTATEEHVRNKILRTWVRQVRDLSYDVEDCIEFVLHLDTTKRSWWLRLLPYCSGGKKVAELPVDEAVAETTLLRARVVDVSQRNIRYNLIVDSTTKPMVSMDPVQKAASAGTSSFHILINAVKKSGPLDLARLISTEDRDLQVVSFCGTEEGDLVQVAIVRKAYCDARICKEFACRAWVKLMHPFNPVEFIRSLMTQFLAHSCHEQANVGPDALERMLQATQGDLIKEFAQKQNNHRYLLVLEDLSTLAQWDAIRSYLPDRKKGSRIVVLTHHPVIASQCTGEPCRVSELQQFSPDHSIRVYYKEGFQLDRVQSLIKEEPHQGTLFGRETEMDELFEKIKKTKESRLISVWGMPGVGKSALVKALYDCKLRTSDQFKRLAWVSVSHAFNPTDFCQNLLLSLDRESTSSEGQYEKALHAEDLIQECRDHLRRVCLLVIDGLQSNGEWDWIKSNLIDGDSGNSIIIITSEESVAKHCAISIDGVYNVKGLDATAASQLFEKEDIEKYLQKVDWETKRLLLRKCGGLPRVIISLARYVDSKPRDLLHASGLEYEMRRVSGNFMHEVSTNPEFDSSRGLLAWIHSYLDSCPRHLKKCMMYLSIFPQDIIIRRTRLIRRWIAEGYFKGTDSITTEKSAEEMFDEVAALSIMQPVMEASKVIGYRVNGFFREYIISRPVEERILFPLEVSILERESGHGRLTTEGIGQHLYVGTTWERDRVLFASLDLSRLRSLTVRDDEWFWSFNMSDRMRVLRVLDLENAPWGVNDVLFQKIGKLPSRLKYLSLRGQRKITILPESVGDLVQLQTLDIRGTSILTLPPFITRLRKLQYIRAGTAIAWTDDDIISSSDAEEPAVGSRSCGVVVPSGIERLEALRTLGAVCVNTADSGEAVLREILKSLPHLKKLEVSGISGKQTQISVLFLGRLRSMVPLKSLSLQFERNNHFLHWEKIAIPTGLRSLKMHGPVQKLPQGIQCHGRLEKLALEMTNTLFTADDVVILGSIRKLQTLRLRVSKDQNGHLQFPATGVIKYRPDYEKNEKLFVKLQVLEITCKSKLHVTFDEGAMEKLEHLKLHCLEDSEMEDSEMRFPFIVPLSENGMQISGLEHLASLKQVRLLGSFDDALKEAVQQPLDSHPNKPALKEMTHFNRQYMTIFEEDEIRTAEQRFRGNTVLRVPLGAYPVRLTDSPYGITRKDIQEAIQCECQVNVPHYATTPNHH